MSRIGKKPITLPKGVTVTATSDFVEVKGPKGAVKRPFPGSLTLAIQDGVATLAPKADVNPEEARRFLGTTRALIAGAVVGVTDGYRRNLKLEGTGYRAELKGQMLNLSLGLSHPVNYELPKSVSAKIPPESKGTVIQLETFDKEALGQTVANLQSFRPPEPYKGKGVQVEGQKIRRKAGKAGGKGGK
jgi:large subunit ribosomal protein L6